MRTKALRKVVEHGQSPRVTEVGVGVGKQAIAVVLTAMVVWLGISASFSWAACDRSRNNFGRFIAHECVEGVSTCAGGDACELDLCLCPATGEEGYIQYCVHPDWCGFIPGCFRPGEYPQCPGEY